MFQYTNSHQTNACGNAQSMNVKAAKYIEALVADLREQTGPVEAGAYAVFTLLCIVGWHMFTDGVFSSLITFSSVIQLFGLVLTMLKVEKQKSFGSLSIKSLQLYVPVYVLRLMCTLFHEGYLPADRSGDWAYQLADVLCLLIVCFLLVKAHKNPTVKAESYFPSRMVVGGCFLLACYIFPRHNLGIWADTFWTGSLYLETFVMIPQLRLLAQEMSVESLTSHSIACTFIYRASNFYFWVVCRLELVRERDQDYVPGYFVVAALAIQTLLLCDFIWFYVKALANRTAMTLPGMDYSDYV